MKHLYIAIDLKSFYADGGKYETINGIIKRIDEYHNKMIMMNDIHIDIDEIIDMQSDIFNELMF